MKRLRISSVFCSRSARLLNAAASSASSSLPLTGARWLYCPASVSRMARRSAPIRRVRMDGRNRLKSTTMRHTRIERFARLDWMPRSSAACSGVVFVKIDRARDRPAQDDGGRGLGFKRRVGIAAVKNVAPV